MKNITVVSDLVIDDLLALFLLKKLNSSQNQIITTFGNIPEKQSFQNAQELISVFAPHWPLFRGSSIPLKGKFEYKWLTDFNGEDGLWGIHPFKKSLQQTVANNIQPTSHLISIAPMTDIYKLFQKYKTVLKTVTIMAGVFKEKGNYTEYAECNIIYDPDAAHLFFSKCQSIDVKVIPLDITRKVFWNEKLIQSIPENNPKNIWIKNILKTWYANYGQKKNSVLKLHDPLAVYLKFFPEEAAWVEDGIEVILKGKQRARTIFNKNNPPCKIALGLKNPERISEKIFKIIFYD